MWSRPVVAAPVSSEQYGIKPPEFDATLNLFAAPGMRTTAISFLKIYFLADIASMSGPISSVDSSSSFYS